MRAPERSITLPLIVPSSGRTGNCSGKVSSGTLDASWDCAWAGLAHKRKATTIRLNPDRLPTPETVSQGFRPKCPLQDPVLAPFTADPYFTLSLPPWLINTLKPRGCLKLPPVPLSVIFRSAYAAASARSFSSIPRLFILSSLLCVLPRHSLGTDLQFALLDAVAALHYLESVIWFCLPAPPSSQRSHHVQKHPHPHRRFRTCLESS